ncbi:MAG: ATP-binding cassette domain-containing protein [Sphingomonadales bacterium]|nr:ATP-binding cassette domain-containing protein [Sphingomonadales bacterium]
MNHPLNLSVNRAQRRTRHAALAAGALAAVAGVGLLAISGWFLTGAALAGAGGMAAVQAFNYLLPSAAIRGLAIVRTLGRYGERLLGHRAALFVLAELRPRLFARLAGAEPRTTAKLSGGEVAAHLGDDVDALENHAIRQVAVGAALAGAGVGLAATALAGFMAAAMLVAGLIAATLLGALLAPRLLAPPNQAHGEAVAAYKSAFAEYAGCSVELAVYGLASRVAATLAEHAAAVDQARLHIVRREAALQGLHGIVTALTVAAVLAAARASLPITSLAALAAAATCEAWGGVIHALVQNPRASAARRRLAALTERPQRPHETVIISDPVLSFTAHSGTVSVAPGARLRIAGPSGSGKTRLLGTLAGLRDDAPETIAIAGQPASTLPFDSTRSLFTLSPQDAPLIAGTVADNLRIARPGVDEAAMWQALAVACLDDTVHAMPAGLHTWIGAEGARLSGGQRKRLSLARALLAERSWLLLDEPSEGLDLVAEIRLAANLDEWLRSTGSGLILANHRPGLDHLCPTALYLA